MKRTEYAPTTQVKTSSYILTWSLEGGSYEAYLDPVTSIVYPIEVTAEWDYLMHLPSELEEYERSKVIDRSTYHISRYLHLEGGFVAVVYYQNGCQEEDNELVCEEWHLLDLLRLTLGE